jgi:LDH2 family malate/lactate/ureidoglycolate dehydrogenase
VGKAKLQTSLAAWELYDGEIEPGINAFYPLQITSSFFVKNAIQDTIQQIKSATPAEALTVIIYPGEQSLSNRKEDRQLGIPADVSVWNLVIELAEG